MFRVLHDPSLVMRAESNGIKYYRVAQCAHQNVPHEVRKICDIVIFSVISFPYYYRGKCEKLLASGCVYL